MSCKARFSFHSSHKLLDIAHIYLGLTFKHCYMLELFYIYRFYFRQVVMIREGKIYQTDYDQLTVCRWTFGHYFKNKNLYLTNKKC